MPQNGGFEAAAESREAVVGLQPQLSLTFDVDAS